MVIKKIDLEQGSEQWLKWRESGIGASDVASALGENQYCSPQMLLNKKVKLPGSDKFSPWSISRMQRGKDLEPLIRDTYEGLTGIKSTPVCLQNDKYPWLLASLDGLSECEKIVLEIKAPNNKVHGAALDGQVVGYYYWQVLAQLIIAEAEFAHFVTYSDDPAFGELDRFAIVRVERDPLKEYTLISKTKLFWDNLVRQRELREKLLEQKEEINGEHQAPPAS